VHSLLGLYKPPSPAKLTGTARRHGPRYTTCIHYWVTCSYTHTLTRTPLTYPSALTSTRRLERLLLRRDLASKVEVRTGHVVLTARGGRVAASQLEVLGLGEPAVSISARLGSRGEVLQRGGDVVVQDFGLAAGQLEARVEREEMLTPWRRSSPCRTRT